MNGKSKCRILKEIRKQIAAENDIEYVTNECKHKGDCLGTCPKCEAEVRYLEEQLSLRRRAGKAVAVSGIAAALMLSACNAAPTPKGDSSVPDSSAELSQGIEINPPEESAFVQGQMVAPEESEVFKGEIVETEGDYALPESTDYSEVIIGEMPDPEISVENDEASE